MLIGDGDTGRPLVITSPQMNLSSPGQSEETVLLQEQQQVELSSEFECIMGSLPTSPIFSIIKITRFQYCDYQVNYRVHEFGMKA